MADIIVFDPKKLKVEKKGRMIMFYDITGPGDPEHVCSFFHDHKAEWLAKVLEDAGIEIVRQNGTAKKAVKRVKRIKK